MHLERGGLRRDYLRRFVDQARRRGVDEIGFTEHAYNFVEAAPLLGQPGYVAAHGSGYRLDDYVALVREARAAGLPVKLGIEMDYVAEREDDIGELLAAYPWDFVVGAVHWLGDWGFDLDPAGWEGRDVEEAYRGYLDRAERAVRSGLFDVFAHPDVIGVFGHRPGAAFETELLAAYERLARAAAATGACLEISSAGARKPRRAFYPDPRLLRRARALDVPITLASDAHEPGEVGWAYGGLVRYARAAGYETLTAFAQRRAEQRPLGRQATRRP